MASIKKKPEIKTPHSIMLKKLSNDHKKHHMTKAELCEHAAKLLETGKYNIYQDGKPIDASLLKKQALQHRKAAAKIEFDPKEYLKGYLNEKNTKKTKT